MPYTIAVSLEMSDEPEMNEGKIRVLFGSTEMLGTGVNAQKRCVAIHHLDAPWVRHEVA